MEAKRHAEPHRVAEVLRHYDGPKVERLRTDAGAVATVAVVAPHAIVRSALRAQLEKDARLSVIEEATDLDGALQVIANGSTEVVVALIHQLRLPEFDALSRLHGALNGGALVLILDAVHSHDIVDVLQVGVRAVLTSEGGLSQLGEAVHEARAGRRYLTASAAALLLAGLSNGTTPRAEARRRMESLSERERQVLDLLLAGQTIAETAVALAIRPHTADTHRRRILEKLALKDVAALFKFAARHGLLEHDA